MRTIKIICLFLIMSNLMAQPLISKSIELHYLQAEQVVELLQPLMKSGEQIKGSGQILVVSVTPQTLDEIRSVLKKIDVQPITFDITIYQGDPTWLQTRHNSVIYSTQSQTKNPPSQTIKVMNGQTALVSMDNQIPIVRAVGLGFFPGMVYQQYNIQTALLVRPLLQGSKVQLAIKRIRQQQNVPGSQQFGQQQIDTTIMAPIDKWISIGTTNGDNNLNQSSTVYSTRGSFIKNSTVYIKVSIVK